MWGFAGTSFELGLVYIRVEISASLYCKIKRLGSNLRSEILPPWLITEHRNGGTTIPFVMLVKKLLLPGTLSGLETHPERVPRVRSLTLAGRLIERSCVDSMN